MRIVLASTSPRRVDLLRAAGLEFSQFAPRTEETVRRGESPRRMVARLAREKAVAVAAAMRGGHPSTIIIAADTTVVAPGGKGVLNKPRDAEDAYRMLRRLCGATHEVLTGYCLLLARADGTRHVKSRVVSSKVALRALSPAQIHAYIATGEPMDKAGAYAAQGIGQVLVERITGSYTNVVGLPMAQLLADLEREFDVVALNSATGRARG
jgi:septum formation protein